MGGGLSATPLGGFKLDQKDDKLNFLGAILIISSVLLIMVEFPYFFDILELFASHRTPDNLLSRISISLMFLITFSFIYFSFKLIKYKNLGRIGVTILSIIVIILLLFYPIIFNKDFSIFSKNVSEYSFKEYSVLES